ncbi:transmembrane protein 255B-like [Oncorhynchus masou masou]
MQQPTAQQPPPQTTTDALDPTAQYMKRRRTALWVTISLLCLSVVVLVVGLVSATRTGNVAVAGYYPGITLSFGAFLGIVGINLLENRRPMLMAAIIFISMGVIASFFCAIVDGIIAAEFIDRRPLLEDRCEFYASGSGYAYDNYYTEVMCSSFNSECKVRMKSNTCYCCDLYNCESPDYHTHYYEFTGVSSCWDVVQLHRLLWVCVVLNIMGLFLGIITAAILGAYKDLAPATQMSPSPAPPPHIMYNPTQHVVTYAGFCPNGQALPAYPNYPALPMQHHSSYQAPSTPQPGLEMTLTPSSPSEESQSQPSAQAPSQPTFQTGSQDPGQGYMLTPNAPALYPGPVYGPSGFEKPPPYAC